MFPEGILQVWDVLENGYWHARSLETLIVILILLGLSGAAVSLFLPDTSTEQGA